MTKPIGRNASCPCGSGKKYKRCCLEKEKKALFRVEKLYDKADMPPDMNEMHERVLQKAEIKKLLGIPKYGHVRPLISAIIQDQRIVIVGNKRVCHSPKWDTFEQFLLDYIKLTFSYEWGGFERKKPFEKQHPLFMWHEKFCEHIRKSNNLHGGKMYSIPATGYMAALLRFGYDLYIVENNLYLPKTLLRRLKNRDQFQGARYELFIVAALLKAGFSIEFENERDGRTTHCELTATDKRGNKYSVEAKSRHRPGVLAFPGEQENPDEIKIGIERLLHEALSKNAAHERLVFVDVNVPGGKAFSDASHWLHETGSLLKEYQKSSSLPAALIVATNHPDHYAEDRIVGKHGDALMGGFRRDDLKFTDVEVIRKQYPEYWDLINAVNFLDEIPQFEERIPRPVPAPGIVVPYKPGMLLRNRR
jgi:hypothetical protein